MVTKRKKQGTYMISVVADMYAIHPQTLRLYEREGLLRPSRSDGNTRLYTDEDLERLEFILNLARDLGVNIAGIAIVLQMRERMEAMTQQMSEFVELRAHARCWDRTPADAAGGSGVRWCLARRRLIAPVGPVIVVRQTKKALDSVGRKL